MGQVEASYISLALTLTMGQVEASYISLTSNDSYVFDAIDEVK